MEQLEFLWDALLSRQPDIIQDVFYGLDEDSRRNVMAHLKAMASEEGWQPEQAKSARAALDALEKQKME